MTNEEGCVEGISLPIPRNWATACNLSL